MTDSRPDLRHALDHDPDASESLAFNVLLPDEGVFFTGYVTIDGRGQARRLAISIPADGPLHIEVDAHQLSPDEDLSHTTIAGLKLEQPDPLTLSARFEGEYLGVDYTFRALHEPFLFDANTDGVAPGIAANRFEQAARVTGTVRIGPTTHAFDTTGHRDHSWGPRDYGLVLHWKWITGQAGDEIAFHAMHTWVQGKQFTNGYVWRDGITAPLVDLQASVWYDGDAIQERAELVLTDALGRRTTVEAQRFSAAAVPFPTVVMAEAGCRMSIDGREGVGVFEQGWQPSYFEHLQQRRHVAHI